MLRVKEKVSGRVRSCGPEAGRATARGAISTTCVALHGGGVLRLSRYHGDDRKHDHGIEKGPHRPSEARLSGMGQ